MAVLKASFRKTGIWTLETSSCTHNSDACMTMEWFECHAIVFYKRKRTEVTSTPNPTWPLLNNKAQKEFWFGSQKIKNPSSNLSIFFSSEENIISLYPIPAAFWWDSLLVLHWLYRNMVQITVAYEYTVLEVWFMKCIQQQD